LLWVAGKDPDLFNYFLPERWRRTPKRKLSSRNQVFYTRTKDNINLVWKVSRMGDPAWIPNPEGSHTAAREYGFNSPFEEFAFALELGAHGVKTVYPRAIYMTGHRRENNNQSDERRYAALGHLKTPYGEPVVNREHDYITLWGCWKGPEEVLPSTGGRYRYAVNARRAFASKMISEPTLHEMMRLKTERLKRCGFEDLNPKPDHLLISLQAPEESGTGTSGGAEARLCNFELVRPIAGSA
jgi:hypothetical protein